MHEAHQNIALGTQLQGCQEVVMLSGDWAAYLLLICDGTRPWQINIRHGDQICKMISGVCVQ